MNRPPSHRQVGASAPDVPAGQPEPYFLGLQRAMISLGPLTNRSFCTFRCRFCYVLGAYPRYANRSVDDIMDWLHTSRDQYDIVYVSGDTDSFAQPRTARAIELLWRLAELKVDVLFTTRHVFTGPERGQLRKILEHYENLNKLLVPCVSVCQLRHPALEPRPIASPEARLDLVRWFHGEGAKVLLTIRPFIPYLDANEYVEIAMRGGEHCAAILGGDWYVDLDGRIDLRTRRALGIPDEAGLDPTDAMRGPLDSTTDGQEWLIYRHHKAIDMVQQAAIGLDRRFFMRSGDAIDLLRQSDEHR